jgi:hypothetical protein
MKSITRVYIQLDVNSKVKLIEYFKSQIPSHWTVYADHMTVVYGKSLIEIDRQNDNGKLVSLTATHIGKSNMAIAIRVNGYYSKNELPHITLAVNDKEGGKQLMSNEIKDWVKLDHEILIYGHVIELYK